MTPATADVLEALLEATDPVWGLKIVKRTGRPAGSVYPILERLERSGWVSSQWEEGTDRTGPRRRLYRLLDGATASARSVIAEVRGRRTKPVHTQAKEARA